MNSLMLKARKSCLNTNKNKPGRKEEHIHAIIEDALRTREKQEQDFWGDNDDIS